MHQTDQETIKQLRAELSELKFQLGTAAAICDLRKLKAIHARAVSEDMSVEDWLRDVVSIFLDKDVCAVFLDKKLYDELCKLGQARNISIDQLMTRSNTTEVLIGLIENGRL